jgi:hypothetical protein
MDKIETVEINNNVEIKTPEINNIENSAMDIFNRNRNLILIFIGVVILIIGGYYLYDKYIKDSLEDFELFPKKSIVSFDTDINTCHGDECTLQKQEPTNILTPDKEYYIVGPDGKSILVNKYFNNIIQSNYAEQNNRVENNRVENKQVENKRVENKRVENKRVEQNIEDNIEDTVQDDNVSKQELTMEEIEELKRQLEIMQKNSQISGLEDDDDNNEAF